MSSGFMLNVVAGTCVGFRAAATASGNGAVAVVGAVPVGFAVAVAVVVTGAGGIFERPMLAPASGSFWFKLWWRPFPSSMLVMTFKRVAKVFTRSIVLSMVVILFLKT